MRAVVVHEPGPIENLRFEPAWADPRPSPGSVLVEVKAAGVCYRDLIDRGGGMPNMKRPVILGHEFAGEVVEVGAGVTELLPGDRVVNLHRAPCGRCTYCLAGHEPRCSWALAVFGITIDGAYAERVVAPAGCLVKIPEALLAGGDLQARMAELAFLHCTAGISLRALRTHGGVVAGSTVLVTGASGGVGIHACQVARALGARTIAVTSSNDKRAALEPFADEVIVSADMSFHREVQRRTGGVDVVAECVGTPTLNSSLRSLRPMGRVVVMGNVSVSRAEVNPGSLILNELMLVGSSGATRRDLEDVLGWVASGKVRPVLADVLPLEQAAQAHQRLASRSVVGRIVLTP